MKKTFLTFIAITILSSAALAETRICRSSDGRVVADISENYIGGTILVRRLHKIESDGHLLYRNWIGKLDDGGEGLQLDHDLFVRMYSGGIDVKTSQTSVTLECEAGF